MAGVTFEDVRAVAAGLPGVYEGRHFDKVAYFTQGNVFLIRWVDGATISVFVGRTRAAELLANAEQGVRSAGSARNPLRDWVVIDLRVVNAAVMRVLVEEAWRRLTPGAANLPRRKP